MIYEPASWTTTETACQPGMAALIAYAASIGIGSLGCYNDRAVRGSTTTPSLHREGRAYDAEANEFTQAFVDDLIGHYTELGVQQIIWQRRSWRCDRLSWRAYDGVDPHTSHAHIELNWAGAKALTLVAIHEILEEDLRDDQIPVLAEAIAEAIMSSPVDNHDYATGEDRQVPFRTYLAWLKQTIETKP